MDRPIIFSAPMIRALLDGRKTMDRRILEPQPVPWLSWSDPPLGTYPSAAGWARFPYSLKDRLWVKEALRMGFDAGTPICHATYAADGADMDLTPDGALHWAETRKRNAISPIHMPRWASRLTLHVTGVRVQRLQEISEADAWQEGLQQRVEAFCRDDFRDLWNSLHGPDAWDANPWVVAVSFTVEKANINQARAE